MMQEIKNFFNIKVASFQIKKINKRKGAFL